MGAAAVVTLMPMDELVRVGGADIGQACEARGLDWFHLPIEDVNVPDARFEVLWRYAGLRLRQCLRAGRHVLVHCRGGLGRSGTLAARLLIELGWPHEEAIAAVLAQRRGAIETPQQEQYVRSLAGPVSLAEDTWGSTIYGCILGGAVGDAFGYAVEFDGLPDIVRRYGAGGLREPVLQQGRLVVSDDTQMTLFTLEALCELLRGGIGAGGAASEQTGGLDAPEAQQTFLQAYRQAYLRWGGTQGVRGPGLRTEGVAGLYRSPALRRRRAPGGTCLSAVSDGAVGRVNAPVNGSKGCGAVMRTAPIGLLGGLSVAMALSWGNAAGALTHGHVDGWLPGGMLAVLVHELLAGRSLPDATRTACALADPHSSSASRCVALTRTTLTNALDGRDGSGPLTAGEVAWLGEGWVGEEALAIGMHAALTQPDFIDAIRVATNHSGDSDSTASIAGQICGARDGVAAVPHAWVRRLDVLDEALALLDDFLTLSA